MTRPTKTIAAVLPDELTEALAAALPPLAPPQERAAAMKSALLERVRGARARYVTVRAEEGEWVQLAPRAHAKRLHDDGITCSFLLRLEPGATLPQHGHAAEETCLVLEGTCSIGELGVRAGDFHIALEGSVHGAVSSRTGALLFIRAASGAGLAF